MARAIAEDVLPLGDLTAGLVPASAGPTVAIVSRAPGVVAGRACAVETFTQIDPALVVSWSLADGADVAPGRRGGRGQRAPPLDPDRRAHRPQLPRPPLGGGHADPQVRGRRAGGQPPTRVLDTRKTTPGLRALEKAAVRAGGGHNHRGSLSEAVLVKDNHLAGLSIAEAVARARRHWPGRMVEVECDRPTRSTRRWRPGPRVVMLDNMAPDEVAECVARVRAAGTGTLVEVSGGMDLVTAPATGRGRRRPRLGGGAHPLGPRPRPRLRSAAPAPVGKG